MRLFEYSEFSDAISAAKDYFNKSGINITEQFIEKDYYVTEALRVIAEGWKDYIIFKGGTSLSKAWNLIERFSEDIDLFLNTDEVSSPPSSNYVKNRLKDIQTAVSEHPNLQFLTHKEDGRSRSDKGVSRNSVFAYQSHFVGNQDIPSRILLEMGIRSGSFPIEEKEISSLLAQFLKESEQSLEADDELPFSMQVLHFRRTFVEKIFAIHSYVIDAQRNNKSIETHARHYYDLFCLLQQDEVLEMLRSDEYPLIKENCDSISLNFFRDKYYPPKNLSFANSEALFPTGELRQMIVDSYKKQCKNLCYGQYPNWEKVEESFENVRSLL